MRGIQKIFVIITVIIIIGAISGVYFLFIKDSSPNYELAIVEKSNLIQEVGITGSVEPVEDIDLAFEKGGRISKVSIAVGEKVAKEQVLIELDNVDLNAELTQANANVASARAQLNQYQATLESEQAKLDELKKGTRPEEIQVAEVKVSNMQKALQDDRVNLVNVRDKAEVDLANLYDEIEDILNDAYLKADNAVNTQTDDLFSNDLSSNPELSFTVTDSRAETDAEHQRVLSGTAVMNLKSEIDNLSSDYGMLDASLLSAKNHLIVIRDFLSRLADALNSEVDLSDATATTYNGYINTARTNVNTELTTINDHINDISTQKVTNQNNIDTAIASVNDAENALDTAEAELALKKAGATPEQIAAQVALVKKAEANLISGGAKIREAEAQVVNIEARLEKTILRAPIDGIITRQDAKTGEIIAANVILVYLISEAQFEIEADVPEADINKISVGHPVTITLDAFSIDKRFDGLVTFIEPSERIIQDVVYYRVIVNFDAQEEDVRSGMTADINIVTAEKKDVLAVPSRTVIVAKDGSKTVRVFENGTVVTKIVTTGIRGDDGKIEILSGLAEGESVIIREIEK